jgi:hypothetical protein
MLTSPVALSRHGFDARVDSTGRRRFKQAVGIALGTVALGAAVTLIVGLFEHQLQATSGAPGTSARVQLPADLFTAPRAPMPRVVVRYAAPRITTSAPMGAPPAAPAAPASTAAPAPPTPAPTPSHHRYPSPSPSPTWPGGDD